MNDAGIERRLSVILAADVVGYSRLMELDDEGTVRALNTHRKSIDLIIANHRGRVFGSAGDSVIAEFASPVEAVRCALEIQQSINSAAGGSHDRTSMCFRIGINLGDVVVEGENLLGDGVNIAARLESISEAGGIALSRSVYDQVRKHLDLEYIDLGEQRLKNIADLVQVFKVVMTDPESASEKNSENLSGNKSAAKPSIAVLPFTNMSGDPEQEHFSDGIAEDIITTLSKVSGMYVNARNSTFVYKDKAVDIKQVGREQNVRYVLEGSVRKAGNRVRVTAQLIDAETNRHVWADRYDRELADIFAVQDEITRNIISELDVHLREGEQSRFWSSGTESVEAWECVRLGTDLLNGYRSEDIPEVMRLGQRAVDIDPEYAAAWVLMAWTQIHVSEETSHSREERATALELVKEFSERALDCDATCAESYIALGLYHLSKQNHEQAILNAEKSVKLAPNHASNLATFAAIMNKCGQPKKGLEQIRKAIRLTPIHPTWFMSILGQSCRLVGDYDQAVQAYTSLVTRQPDSLVGYVNLAATHGEFDQIEQAENCAAEVLRINPDFSIRSYVGDLAYSDPDVAKSFEDSLGKSGLPD